MALHCLIFFGSYEIPSNAMEGKEGEGLCIALQCDFSGFLIETSKVYCRDRQRPQQTPCSFQSSQSIAEALIGHTAITWRVNKSLNHPRFIWDSLKSSSGNGSSLTCSERKRVNALVSLAFKKNLSSGKNTMRQPFPSTTVVTKREVW